MKVGEMKAVTVDWANKIIDVWFGNGGFAEKMIKPALRVMVKVNVDKMDDFLKAFTKKDGTLMVNELIDEYIGEIPEEGLVLNMSDFLGNNAFARSISPKLLERSDLVELKRRLSNVGKDA